MEFYDVIDQIIGLLKQRERVTYRAIKRQFNIDDEFIEDLKAELIQAQRLAIDEEGAVLVWTGKTEEKSAPASLPDQPEPYPVVGQVQTVRETSSSVKPHTPEAERRHLTVMFVDLVGSTNLAGELDPEDYREVVRQYQQVCAEVIQRYDGHVAQLLGDGLLVYFGYPQAHEDDAQRAVRAGLGSVEAIRSLNTGLEQEKGIKLAVRLGIHTGLVVVGEMGGSGRQEQLAMGETPNVAARIQGIAQPDTVVISADTYRLVQGYFDCEPLGEHDLRGGAQPIVVYRVLRESGLQSRLEVASTRGLTPLVGRESESTLLFERWAQAKDDEGQVILLSGEAGIGKSRLVQVLKEHVAEGTHICLECRSSIYFINSALYPIIDMLQRVLQWQQYTTSEERLANLEQNLNQYRLPLEESVPLLAPLLSLSIPEERYAPLALSSQRQRQMTLEAIVTILLELAERQPVLFILEDLHWVDPTTLEFLTLLVDQGPTARILALWTFRPDFSPPWTGRSHCTQVTLQRLPRHQAAEMTGRVAHGKALPPEVVEQIVARTDGVPLFVEELTKMVLESGLLQEREDGYALTGPLPPLAIPATLHDSLLARLDRLATVKGLAQLGATLGGEFSYALLRAVSPWDEETVHRGLHQLVAGEFLYQRGLPPQATYRFKHTLIQEAAYQSVLKRTRQRHHQHIAQVLEAQFPETAETQPELLAHHYTEAGLNEQAIGYWQRAGQRAIERSAHQEAVRHLCTGLELLATRPETPERTEQELALHMALGPVLMAIRGLAAAEVEQTYTRAWALCQQLGETPQRFAALRGLWRVSQNGGRLAMAREVGEQLLTLAQREHDAPRLLAAHAALGFTLTSMGAFTAARRHLEQGIALIDPETQRTLELRYGGAPPGVQCLIYAALTLWSLGYPDQGLARSQATCTLARELGYPVGLATALFFAAYLHLLRGEAQAARDQAEATIALSTEYTLPQTLAQGRFALGWVLAAQGQGEEGVTLMRQGVTDLLAMGTRSGPTSSLPVLAEACGALGQIDAGLSIVAEALALVEQTGVRRYEAETHRIKGTLLLHQAVPDASQAEVCFQQALDIARRQEAKSWELRAATSLARLWQRQGNRQEAYDLLAPVYDWFTEGFDTADLQEAKQLLDELAA